MSADQRLAATILAFVASQAGNLRSIVLGASMTVSETRDQVREMPTVEASIVIACPIEKVFVTMVNPKDIPRFAPVQAVSNVKGDPQEKGSSADYEYRFGGMKLTQTMTVLEVQAPTEIAYEMSGGFPGRWTYNLEQGTGGTIVKTTVQYSVPGGIIGRIADWLVFRRMNQGNLDRGQLGLKRFCESSAR